MDNISPEININDERAIRLKKLEELREAGVNPYPARVKREHTLKQALEKNEGDFIASAGRIMTKRDMGKLTFCHLQDNSGQMQVAFKQGEIDEADYKLFVKKIDIGDIISVEGEKFTTHKGEPSILVKKWNLLAKSLLPLPDKFHGLQDEEARYRKRYIDFLVNPEEKEKILARGRILRYMREFMFSKDFVEVETPVLETIASGAMAKTFDTHLNAYNLPVHLRICMGELWQKRLLVGGFERTFEMGRAFRNEGVDHQHNPEFTMIEYYWAYADYEDNMKMHEELIPFVVEKSVGKLEVEVDGQKINFAGPYKRITFHDAVLEYSGIDINNFTDVESLAKEMKTKGYDPEDITERGKLIDELYKQSTRPKLIQPTFVLNYPIELKPLAKKAEDSRYTEMFQLIVNGFELSNSYTELNDPVDQRERFAEQVKNKAEGDEEAMNNDWDYVEALEHGMPPATGTGIGIDRFAALITGSHTLREVTLFPLMKPVEQNTDSTDF
ncbi:MAG: lysine--tRNA ligase [Candidatus Magasanikiibacteriota bacterium]